MSTSNLSLSRKRKRSIEVSEQSSLGPLPSTIEISGNARVHIGDQYFSGKDAEQDAIDTLAKSLHFPEVLRRYENIREQHNGTYEWIFRTNGTTSPYDSNSNDTFREFHHEPLCDSFVAWLRSEEQPIYWISGKPGSGKSTLMKYLVDSLQTFDIQNECSALTLSFWFWEAGQELERNLEGCLRSLLWQCLQCSLTRRIVYAVLRQHVPGSIWTRPRLIKSFNSCLSSFEDANISVRIFLDGLDESGSDATDLLELLNTLRQQNKVLKICVSSRSEQMFVDEFSSYPKLRLQDLNAEDISKVIREDFLENPKVERLLSGKDDLAAQLAGMLVDKAQGVFLWVILAIRSLIRGLMHRDSIEILEFRLRLLPRDLDDLYSRMLGRNEDDRKLYREDAAFCFRLVLDNPDLNLCELCFASNEGLRRRMVDPPFEFWDHADFDNQITSEAEQVSTWITIRTGGFLETTKDKCVDPPLGTLVCQDRFAGMYVDFIHRTARSYLLDTKAGQEVLSACTLTHDELKFISFEAHLVDWYILCGLNREYIQMFEGFEHRQTYYVSRSSDSIDNMISILSELSRRDLLCCTSSLPGTTALSGFSFPSTEDGVIDACKVCCYFGWYQDAQRMLLANPQKHEDVAYLSTLLVYAFYPLFEYDLVSKLERDAFLCSVLELGGDPLCEVDSTYDGRISVLPLIILSKIGKDLRLLIDQSIMQQSQWTTARYLPSIEVLEFYSYRRYSGGHMDEWMFWTELNMSDLMRQRHRQKLPLNNSEPSRVWIVGHFKHSFDGDVRLFAITEEESGTLLTMLDELTTELQVVSNRRLASLMLKDGLIVMNKYYDLPEGCTQQRLLNFLDNLTKHTQPFETLLEAVLYTGKSEEAVRRYVADEEIVLRGPTWNWTEARISSWKSWVLGPS